MVPLLRSHPRRSRNHTKPCLPAGMPVGLLLLGGEEVDDLLEPGDASVGLGWGLGWGLGVPWLDGLPLPLEDEEDEEEEDRLRALAAHTRTHCEHVSRNCS